LLKKKNTRDTKDDRLATVTWYPLHFGRPKKTSWEMRSELTFAHAYMAFQFCLVAMNARRRQQQWPQRIQPSLIMMTGNDASSRCLRWQWWGLAFSAKKMSPSSEQRIPAAVPLSCFQRKCSSRKAANALDLSVMTTGDNT
jgi:hypothetical protein